MAKKIAERYKTNLKRGDEVQVIAGKDRGKIGKIVAVDRRRGQFKVEGVNLLKKHMKPTNKNQRGGIISIEGAINFSNVLLYSKSAKRGLRTKAKIEKGNKTREFVK